MADLYSRDVSRLGGVFTSDRGKLSFAPNQGLPVDAALVQNVTFQYQQNVTRFYEVGGNRIYYVGGRTMGNASIGRIIGPSVVLGAFYRKFGNVCNAADNTILFSMQEADCSGISGSTIRVSYTLKLAVLVSVSAAIGAQDMIINENSQLMFGSLEFDDSSTGLILGSAVGVGASAIGTVGTTL